MKTFKEFLLMEDKWDERTYLDSNGQINLARKELEELPFDFSSFDVKGFYCEGNKLTSLKGSPKSCEVIFNCSSNKLINLVGSPEKVMGYDCSNNTTLKSLKGLSTEIGFIFKCEFMRELFEVSPILHCKIGGQIIFSNLDFSKETNLEIQSILNKYKNNPRNLIKMLVELKQIDKRFC